MQTLIHAATTTLSATNPRHTRSNSHYCGSRPANYQDVRDDQVFSYFDLVYDNTNKETTTYRVQLNAAYAGRYYLPTVGCEAMYDNRIWASTPGKWVEVI